MTLPHLSETNDAVLQKRKVETIRLVSRRLLIALLILLSIGGTLMFYSVWFEGKGRDTCPLHSNIVHDRGSGCRPSTSA
jgi:hypothetical protein